MQLWAGSYERFVFCIDTTATSEGVHLAQQTSVPAHRAAVKCVASAGGFVATGGADDQIHIFDAAANNDLGYLINPVDGAVPCLAFVTPEGTQQPSHFLSGSVPGPVSIWGTQDAEWRHIKAMKGHNGTVNALAVHPTGTLALSVSRDTQMRLWDLSKGSCAYQAPLGAEAGAVQFLQQGSTFAVAASNTVTLHSIKGERVGALQHDRKVLCCAPAQQHLLVCGCEGGALSLWDVRKPGTPLATIQNAHSARIRGLLADVAARAAAADAADAAVDALCEKLRLCATASSDGYVKLWDLEGMAQSGGADAQPLAALNVGARFTSLCAVQIERTADVGAVAHKQEPSRGKKKRYRDEQSESVVDAAEVPQQRRTGGEGARGKNKRKQAEAGAGQSAAAVDAANAPAFKAKKHAKQQSAEPQDSSAPGTLQPLQQQSGKEGSKTKRAHAHSNASGSAKRHRKHES